MYTVVQAILHQVEKITHPILIVLPYQQPVHQDPLPLVVHPVVQVRPPADRANRTVDAPRAEINLNTTLGSIMHHMTRIIFSFFFIASLNSQSASEAIHLLEDEMGFGARSLSLGGAYTALGNDPSGMYWNPAGLTGMQHGVIYVESSGLNYNNNTTYINQTKSNPITKVGLFNGMGIAYPIPTVRGSMVVAMGYNRILHYDAFMSFSGFSVRDNSLEIPINDKNYLFSKNVQRSEHLISNGGVEQLTFSFGIALSPNTSGGLSISRITGKEDYEFKFTQEDLQNTYTEFPSDFNQYNLVQSLITKTKGWNIRGGLKAAVNEWVSVGMALSLPHTMKVEEQHGTNEEVTFDNGDKSDTTDFAYYDYEVKIPMIIDMGMALTVENLAISSSLRFKNWGSTQYNLNNLDTNSEEYLLLKEENSNISFGYRPVFQLRAGVEYLWEFSDSFGITLRGGGGLLPSPEENSKKDQSFYSFGLGVPMLDVMMIDFAYIITKWEKPSQDWLTPSGAVEEVKSGRLLLNLSYLF